MGLTRVLLTSALALTLAWILLRKDKVKHEVEFLLTHVQPSSLFPLFSSHQNLMGLNPTILSYTLLSDDPWTGEEGEEVTHVFSLTYQEHLVYFPFIRHEAEGRYKVIYPHQPNTTQFLIISHHLTKVLGSSLETNEVMRISLLPEQGEGEKRIVRISSSVEYECPLLLTLYCQLEFRGQRALIHNNIQQRLSSPPHKLKENVLID